jgi:hypothetical protein
LQWSGAAIGTQSPLQILSELLQSWSGRNPERIQTHATQAISLLYSSGVSYPGNHFAAQQNRFLTRKSFCCTAESFPDQEIVLLHSKIVS